MKQSESINALLADVKAGKDVDVSTLLLIGRINVTRIDVEFGQATLCYNKVTGAARKNLFEPSAENLAALENEVEEFNKLIIE